MALIDTFPRLSFLSLRGLLRLRQRTAQPSAKPTAREQAVRAAAAQAHRDALRRNADRLLRDAGVPFF